MATLDSGDDAELLLNKADLALHESKCESHLRREMKLAAERRRAR